MLPFDYPIAKPRRHGPQGYKTYDSYRPWLRDEFDFRCVYCLAREQWGRVTGEFDIDHFLPQARGPELAQDYDNLVYACRSCNLLKGSRILPDPRQALTAETVVVNPDGAIEGLTKDAWRLIRVLHLDSASYNRWRVIWIRIIELARDYSPQHYRRLMGFPDDLPDLSKLRPPAGNTRPDGIEASYHAQRMRGELADVY